VGPMTDLDGHKISSPTRFDPGPSYRLVLPVNLCDSFKKFCLKSRLVFIMIQEVGEGIEGIYFELLESTARNFICRYRGK